MEEQIAPICWPARGNQPPPGSVGWVVGVGHREGTGAAVARRLAAGGVHVVLTGRTFENLRMVADEIMSLGGRASVAPGDVTSDDGLSEALDLVKRTGPLRILVYNAGGSQYKPSILDMDTDFFENVWRINCLGAFVSARESARLMLEQGGGVILFSGTVSALKSAPKLTAYAAAKFGQRAIAQSFAQEFGPSNIHVAHIIIAGPIDGNRLNSKFPAAKSQRAPDGMLRIEHIAETYWQVLVQPRDCWTSEIDIRPYCEKFD